MGDRDPKDTRKALEREEERLARLEAERAEVLRRIARLKAEVSSAESPSGVSEPEVPLQRTPRTSAEKVALFRSLFRGRTDVFPKRWSNPKKGSQGYAPACANEWVRGVCEKPRVKCGECPNQAFIPVSDEVILQHLRGKCVAGVYPLLEDETCWFLAVDFDKGEWKRDVSAFIETCREKGLVTGVERSRSGDGAHAWFFFRSPVAASAARKMGCYLITETMTRRHELPMTSYDRLFPNQDTMPSGRFGNLIALPFQYEPRKQGNTLFVDDSWTPYQEQWAFLASLPRIEPARVESLALEGAERGRVIGVRMSEPARDEDIDAPWTRPPSRQRIKSVVQGPLPARISAVLANLLFVEKAGLPSALINEMKRLAAFQNPEFYKKQGMRLSTALTPRVINCAEDLPQHVALPRGCLSELKDLLDICGVALEVDDRRTEGDPLDVRFHGELTPIQEKAVEALLEHETGVFVAPPGSGKTVVGTNLVARRGRSTLVLVHRIPLLEQWITQLSVFLDLKPEDIGRIGGGKRKPSGRLDVAMIQSLARGEVNDIVAGYGHVIVDECHHIPAVSFERVMREVNARFITGLTATPLRRDGHHPILKHQFGPLRFRIDPKSHAATRFFKHQLIVRDTDFRLASGDANVGIQEVYRHIVSDERRNELILDDVIRALEEGRSPILLTERRDHLDYFADRLHGFTRNLIVLKGGMPVRERRAVFERLASIPDGEERLLIATGRFAGEGFDDARLDTLFLAMPVSWRGTLVQYAGRLHRHHHAKTEVRIMDYVDRNVPMLARMFERRMRGYRAMGYEIVDYPASEAVVEEHTLEYDDTLD